MQNDEALHRLHHFPTLCLHIETFQNNDNGEKCARFAKSEPHNLIGRLGLEEHVFLNCLGHFFMFHREELLLHALIKLVHGLPYAVMSDLGVSGSPNRW